MNTFPRSCYSFSPVSWSSAFGAPAGLQDSDWIRAIDQGRSDFEKGIRKGGRPKAAPLFNVQRMVFSPVLFFASVRFTASTGIISRRYTNPACWSE